ncbi:MAG TPA: helix-turn-helix domain-containing protein [Thermoanaerobaculia bacterium]|nr:helix-turn-helix domain-containing protein [Thermoanaerobaculia bacterium]
MSSDHTHASTNGHRKLLSPQEAADLLGVSWRTLEGWRQRGAGPVYVRLSTRRIRYRIGDLDAFVSGQRRSSTSARRPPVEVAS